MFSNISKYDEALKELITKVYKRTVIYEPVDTAFEYAFKQTSDNQKFPMISFFRDPTMEFGTNNYIGYKKGTRYQDKIDERNEDLEIIGSKDEIRKKCKIFIY